MIKVKKTYRLNLGTIDQIQAIKEYYARQGFYLSDSQIIEKAMSVLMDCPKGIEKDDV